MSDDIDRLSAALRDRYTIERELGRGGMATVYLARDMKHHRPVALKVLHPQLAAVLGSERFLREIATAANLNHPHILPLFDSGTAGQRGSEDALLWYAMPLVEGESLRDRLTRETQLPLADALQITREVADALGYAHTRGIVHRDIKPENILLAHGHALVADFGIARAIGAAGGEKLTETGLSLGTPSYMSPEQALGEPVDGRSDIYALGCVLYEMLAGEPPYTGPTAQAILARRLSMPVPSLRLIRDNLPPTIERIVLTALARAPADRFATAMEFATAVSAPLPVYSPTAAIDSRGPASPAERWTRPRLTRKFLVVGSSLALLIMAVIAAVRWWPAPAPSLDQSMVAVVPFRVAGNDPSLAYLREGMLDLLATKLNGDAGPRAVEPKAVMRIWDRLREDRPELTDEEALEVARELGAGRLILGSVIGTPGRLVLSAALLDVETGRAQQQTTVDGLHDSLPWLADRLAVELLALDAGVESRRLSSLTSASLPAVRHFLNGRSDMRAGRWQAAIERFNEALALDSGFAVAALNMAAASVWTDGNDGDRGLRLAQEAKDRLSFRDRNLLEARVRSQISTWEAFVRKYPDVPEAWSALGDAYYHDGPLRGIADADARALNAFRQAIALDPDTTGVPYAEPMMHLADLSLLTGDTAGTTRLLSRLIASDSTGKFAVGHKLALAEITGDTARVTQLRREFPKLPWEILTYIVIQNQQSITRIGNAQDAMDALRNNPDVPPDLVRALAYGLALNRGRPGEASRQFVGENPGWVHMLHVSGGLYWQGDTTVAGKAAESLAVRVAVPPPPASNPDLYLYYYDVCMLEQWRLGHHDGHTARASIARLRAAALVPGIQYPEELQRCADLLDAWYAQMTNQPDALQRMLRVDSLQIADPVGVTSSPITASNLIMARLWRERGDWSRAEAAARRRYTGLTPRFLSTHLLEEGRAAAQAGHREAAIRALRHFLALRYDPEPSMRHEVELVRAELAQLIAEPR